MRCLRFRHTGMASLCQHPFLMTQMNLLTRLTCLAIAVLPLITASTCAASDLPVASEEIARLLSKGRTVTTVDIDNDSLLLDQSDGFYTSGVRISKSYRLPSVDGWHSVGWRIGQQIYTASDVRLNPENIARFDHPYAGWLYAGGWVRAEHVDGSEVAVGLDLGCIGPCAGGGYLQNLEHRWLKQPRPRGWSTQIRNELGVVLQAGGRAPAWKLTPELDLRPGLSFRLGNIFTDLTADATLRTGSALSYGYLRGAVRAVGYDATLQGGLFSDTTVRTVKPRRWTNELELGYQWLKPQWGLRLSVIRRSNEIKGLSAREGSQSFLRVSISW